MISLLDFYQIFIAVKKRFEESKLLIVKIGQKHVRSNKNMIIHLF